MLKNSFLLKCNAKKMFVPGKEWVHILTNCEGGAVAADRILIFYLRNIRTQILNLRSVLEILKAALTAVNLFFFGNILTK